MARFTHEKCAVYFYITNIGGDIYHDVSSNRIMISGRGIDTSDLSKMVSMYNSATGKRVKYSGVKIAVNLIADEYQVCRAGTSCVPIDINNNPIKDAVRKATASAHDRGDPITLPSIVYLVSKIVGCDKKDLRNHKNLIRSYLIDLGFRQRWESPIHGSDARELYYKRGHAPVGAYDHSTPIKRAK